MDLLSHVMRLPYVKGLWARLPVGRVDLKVQYGIYPRPHYAYGVYWAAYLASCIGVPRITAIELGVAGGRGGSFSWTCSWPLVRSFRTERGWSVCSQKS